MQLFNLFDAMMAAQVNLTCDFIDYDGSITAYLNSWAELRGHKVEHTDQADRIRVGMAARIVVIRLSASVAGEKQDWRPADMAGVW
jgi:hypothetical protein